MRKKKKAKLSFSELILLILIVLFVFNWYLRRYGSYWNYVDEVIELVIVFGALFKFFLLKRSKKILDREERFILINMIILTIIGLFGNFASSHQFSIFAIVVDLLGWQKFFLVYVCMCALLKSDKKEHYKLIMEKLAKIFIIGSVIFYILNLTHVLNMLTVISKQTNMMTFYLLGHPSSTSALCALAISILLQDIRKNKLYLFLGILLSICTFTTKAYAFIAIVFFLILFSKKKISIKHIMIAGIIVFVLAYDEISYYFLNPNIQRGILLRTSFTIAKNFFPIGTGFATYGTVMSTKYYSRTYYAYNLAHLYGISPQYNAYVGDGGWATIIGQFGFSGTLLILSNLVLIYNSYKKKNCNLQKPNVISVLAILAYALISSTNEVFFNADVSTIFAIVLATIMQIHTINDAKKENIKE